MKTFSIVAGTEACNARCPFCISKMTPKNGIELKPAIINWRNFKKSALFAKQKGFTTVMITSKGEPTLFPNQITEYLENLKEFNFPFIEIQTNGIAIAEQREKFDPFVKKWYDLGLTLSAISIVHYSPERNKEIYLPYKNKYIDLPNLISYLHDNGLSVRLSTILLSNFIDNKKDLERLVLFAKENKVEELTIRPVNKPEDSIDQEVYDWTKEHQLKKEQLDDMVSYLNDNGKLLLQSQYGAKVYDINGQNLCLTNSLTSDTNEEEIRQLIFFPDGHLRYDWQYAGAVLLWPR